MFVANNSRFGCVLKLKQIISIRREIDKKNVLFFQLNGFDFEFGIMNRYQFK